MYKFGLKVQLSNKLFEDAVKNGMLDSILDGMFYKVCVLKFKEHDLVYSNDHEYGLQLLGQSSNLTKSKSHIIIFERHYVTASKLPFATKLDK